MYEKQSQLLLRTPRQLSNAICLIYKINLNKSDVNPFYLCVVPIYR